MPQVIVLARAGIHWTPVDAEAGPELATGSSPA